MKIEEFAGGLKLEFFSPTKIIVGRGSIQRVGEEVSRFGKKCLVICGQKFAREEGWLDRILQSLEDCRVKGEVFSGVEPNPGISTVERGRKLCEKFKPDCILALGGGSVIDTAKALALLFSQGGTLDRFFLPRVIEEETLPVVAIPTTAGTGSEVTRYSVITVGRRKKVLMGYSLIPRVAILDSLLLQSLPPQVVLASGLDAFSHALEALWVRNTNPLVHPLAERAIELILDNLPPAFSRDDDLISRENLLFASLLAGISINSCGTGLIHGMSHPLTTFYDLPHGIANAILMPYVMEFNFPAVMRVLARLAELGDESYSRSLRNRAWDGIQMTISFLELFKVPFSLEEVGVKKEDLKELALISWESQRNVLNNPRMARKEDLEKIYFKAWEGELGEEVFIE